MKRFFVDEITRSPYLRGDEHKHLTVVLRAKAGDEVILCTGDGYDAVCRIDAIGKSETKLSLVETVKNDSEPTIRVTLFSSYMKGDKNDLVVQKATELGAAEIYPLITEYVQAPERNIKIDRLNRIASEAAKQCGRSVLTKVREPISFADMLNKLTDYDTVVFPYEKADGVTLKAYLSEQKRTKSIHNVAIVIGSEGGFSDKEATVLAEAGVVPLTLGKRIMRAETANIAVLSAVMYELEQWQ